MSVQPANTTGEVPATQEEIDTVMQELVAGQFQRFALDAVFEFQAEMDEGDEE